MKIKELKKQSKKKLSLKLNYFIKFFNIKITKKQDLIQLINILIYIKHILNKR